MKILNRFLLFTFIVCILLSILLYFGLKNEVGDITKDNNDNPSFKTKGKVYQYYQSGAKYKGDRKEIKDILLSKKIESKTLNQGWIVTRFIVNSQGITDRFRFFCIDKNYNNIKLDSKEEKYILNIIRSLKNWQIGEIDNANVDSYYQITFKVENGKVTDIF
ncbi:MULTISPECIES: hypothetical protein [unclassified Chryseobacterium]|uniref:hypothetical protein n=1 Tax=unclassified Chryseobacterium TaxID=2593645 RepID=UPI002882F785|nr:hypothetical protein [Chryseobacterium sp. SG20098]WNI38849.1 hypothetical protein RHP76_10215 [Chryseobacterium sp. SG20098]